MSYIFNRIEFIKFKSINNWDYFIFIFQFWFWGILLQSDWRASTNRWKLRWSLIIAVCLCIQIINNIGIPFLFVISWFHLWCNILLRYNISNVSELTLSLTYHVNLFLKVLSKIALVLYVFQLLRIFSNLINLTARRYIDWIHIRARLNCFMIDCAQTILILHILTDLWICV